jgi:hypothetical protein
MTQTIPCMAVSYVAALPSLAYGVLSDGSERSILSDGVAFTRRLRHLSFQRPFERISDPQIPPTRQIHMPASLQVAGRDALCRQAAPSVAHLGVRGYHSKGPFPAVFSYALIGRYGCDGKYLWIK